MAEKKYIVGIDLGTTNSVVAYADAVAQKGREPEIRLFSIPQLTGPGLLEEQQTLPSFVLLPSPHDVPPDALALPWDDKADKAVGAFARDRGAEIPHRLVSSAKSWLCHFGVDRTKPILPWGADKEQKRLSPVEASAAVLKHIKDAWNFIIAGNDPSLRLENQEIVLTVPASFDAVARELTVNAAASVGIENLILLEEPQAAFYAWIFKAGENWRKMVSVGDVVLVCDIGGGTSDFSLISVGEEDGNLTLSRIAVGNHLLVGGDNMDLALAHMVAQKLAGQGKNLDSWQMRGLWQNCRSAKEKLLMPDGPASHAVTVLGRGSGLIAGTIKSELTAKEVFHAITEGFFPLCEKDACPVAPARSGMREMGLVYEADPADTRHMDAFLQRAGFTSSMPSAVLFNGGVMKAASLKARVLEAIGLWDEAGQGARELGGNDPDLAVAKGAAYYGLSRHGQGVRIRGGLNKTYFVGIEAAMPAVPGLPAPQKALCVAPFGMEEDTREFLTRQEFGLVVGEKVKFDFLASDTRHEDKAGDIIEDWSGQLYNVSTLETELSGEAGAVLPVTLEVFATQVGTLELWCVAADGDKKWKLEFNVREKE
jgi:molecular chaperone DnaK (HSP70)